MKVIADLHIHSRFARACSKDLNIQNLDHWARMKGVHVLGTGDCVHPQWLAELKRDLEPAPEQGLFIRKDGMKDSTSPISNIQLPVSKFPATRFMLTTELSCIYRQGEKTRRVHHLVFFPSFDAVDRFADMLTKRGCNIKADGRPILGLSSQELLRMVMEVDSKDILVPAHAWTPWFAIFGSKSGFNSIEECFGDLSPNIVAIETGLSSDPPMNWRLSKLDSIALISNSDAHSLPNIGREANELELSSLSYDNIIQAIKNSSPQQLRMKNKELRIKRTIEFYPEEGMYHVDGHRACNVRWTPEETKKNGGRCTRCGLSVTVGVLNRVDNLADRSIGMKPDGAPNFVSLVELDKIIAEALNVVGRKTKRVQAIYDEMILGLGPELAILLDVDESALRSVASQRIIDAMKRVREGRLVIEPGYDGVYGKVSIFSEEEQEEFRERKQTTLF